MLISPPTLLLFWALSHTFLVVWPLSLVVVLEQVLQDQSHILAQSSARVLSLVPPKGSNKIRGFF